MWAGLSGGGKYYYFEHFRLMIVNNLSISEVMFIRDTPSNKPTYPPTSANNDTSVYT